jgi:hypothetical protein
MNVFGSYALNLVVTLIAAALLTLLLKAALHRILVDLCGTEERAHFWMLFAMIMLIAMPVVIALGYTPQEEGGRELFFDLVQQLRGNLLGYLFTLGGVGLMISFFSLFAPKPSPQ